MRVRRTDNPAVLKKEAKSPLADAIKGEIRRLLDAPNFTLGTLRAVERVAAHGRAMLAGQAELDTLLGDTLSQAGDDYSGLGSLGVDDGYGGMISGPLVGSPSVENFGSKALRELISLVPKLNKSKSSLVSQVRALAEARKLGLDDVADKLEKELTGALDVPPGAPQRSEVTLNETLKELTNEVVHPVVERRLSPGAEGGNNGADHPGSNGAGNRDAQQVPEGVSPGGEKVDPVGGVASDECESDDHAQRADG
jgi:hypothetical protein